MNDLDAFRDEFDLALITSDEHVDPLDSPEEMEVHSAIGVFGYKLKPQIRLKLGDHFNLRSANEKRGSALMGSLPPEEGQDLHDDLQAGRAAFKLEEQIFEVENQRHIDHRHPERGHSYDLKWMCGGNHEDFLSRYSKRVHSAKKLISEKMVENIAAEFGYGYTRFMHPVILGGICFRHAHPGDNGKPIGIQSWLPNMAMSAVGGHGHRYQLKEIVRPDKTRVTTMMLPMAMHHAKTNRMLTRTDHGLVIARNARRGDFRHEFVRMDEVLQEYRDYKMSQRRKSDASLQAIIG